MAKRVNKTWREELEQEEVPGEAALDEQKNTRPRPEDEMDIVHVDPGNEADQSSAPGEIPLDFDTIDADLNAREVMDDIDDYTDDEAILQDFAERQRMTAGSDELLDKLRNHHSKDPGLSGEDLDAAWEDSDVSGEESVGASVPTPDQDIVEELGEAFGVNYMDAELLHTDEKLSARDQSRWELNPASAEDLDDQDDEIDVLEIEDLEELLNEELASEEEELTDDELEGVEDSNDEDDYYDLDNEDMEDYLDEYLENLTEEDE